MPVDISIDTVIRGHHVYKDVWTPIIGEVLQCEKEEGNSHDLYAVAVKKLDSIVGHVPRTISTLYHLFLSRGGSITCTVTGIRKYSDDLPQGGLEVPCQLTFRGDEPAIEKVKKLLHDKPKDQPTEVVKSQKTIEEMVKAKQPHIFKQNSVDDTNSNEKSEINVGSKVKEPVASATGKAKISGEMVKSKCEVLFIAEESDDGLSDDKIVWLKMCHIQLLESDRKALLTFGHQLNDKHINLAQKLL